MAAAGTGVEAFRASFVDGTLPLFVERGWDPRHDGLCERLTPELAPDPTPFRRSMVHGRQLYVYSIWAERLRDPGLAANADQVFERLVRHFRDRDWGGWIDKTGLDHAPLSTDKVLYTHAFVLFGLTAYRHCLDRRDADPHLEHTLDYVSTRFRREPGLYFDLLDRSGRDISDGVDQNPLMHLLEAVLFLYERAGDPAALEIAHGIVDTATGRILRDGLVLEHLTRDLEPHPETGHIVEPGHQVEWGWLLNWYGRLTGSTALEETARTLVSGGIEIGWDAEHGGLFDQVHRQSRAVLRDTKRLWPLEELIKAGRVYPDRLDAHGLTLDGLAGFLSTRYLRPDGTWRERLNRDLSVADPTMPASSCYHTSLALTEALRDG